MNVLILTPDRVGSTLLQRLITIYMNMHNYDRPVINLHELTNGLLKYYNPRFNREVLGRYRRGANDKYKNGYFQTLPEVIDLLSSTDHYKTSRLAHYHIVNRQDSIKDQLPFYQYLNDNFFIISAQRQNLLEHTLSWCIQLHSKKLNVFSHDEKIDTFLNIYQNPITVEPESMIKYLNQYLKYLEWVDNHFHVSSYFKYERDLPSIEKYILNLPIFNNQTQISWESNFSISWQDWNQCHYLLSDLSGLSSQFKPLQLTLNQDPAATEYQLEPLTNSVDIVRNLSSADQRFLQQKLPDYKTVDQAINELVEHRVLPTPVPIKLQTMAEKRLIIKNFDQCVLVYNDWALMNGFAQVYTDEMLTISMAKELKQWHAQPKLT